MRNAESRWKEHNDMKKESEPAKHLRDNQVHSFTWKLICMAPKLNRKRKNLEATLITLLKPSLNNQLETKSLILFRNGIT